MESDNESSEDGPEQQPPDKLSIGNDGDASALDSEACDTASPDPASSESPDSSSPATGTFGAESAAKEDASSVSTASTRGARRAGLIAFVVALFVFTALNWPYQYTNIKSSVVGTLTTSVDFKTNDREPPTMAGVPFRYLISFPERESAPANRLFSPLALVYDIGLALIPIALITFGIYRRSKRLASKSGQSSDRQLKRITISDLLTITMLLAIPLGLWQHASAAQKAEKEFANRIKRADGAVRLEAWVPRVFASYIPKFYSDLVQRIRIVRIESPSDELLSEVVAVKGLTGLRIGGSDYDLRTLDRLHGSPFVDDLRVAGRALDTRTLQGIVSCPQLSTLNLMRTNVNVPALSLLSKAKTLRRLCLVHTDVKLSELGTPAWSESIQELRLPHPESGNTDTLEISGWPKLRRVSIIELDTLVNPGEMKVTLSDLPELNELELDAFQKFDLTLRDLPKLSGIKEAAFEWRSRIPRGGTAPGKLWFSRLDIDNLPELKGDIAFYGVDLKSFRTRGTPKVKQLLVGAYFRTVSKSPYAKELSSESASALINGIGESDGPPLADLDAVPLAGVDLSPLKNNKGLNQILLSQSKTNLSQWKGLEGMDWLKRLEVKECEIDSEGVKWILDSFPNLEHFAFSQSNDMFFSGPSQGFALEVVDKPHLKTLDFGDSSRMFFSKVRVVNSPNLQLDLHLQYVRELELVNASSITGLAIEGPLPPNFKLDGMRDLSYLALGGQQIDDKVIESIRQCDRLETLTLAYPSASAESLKTLNLSRLTALFLPGANVDDSVVEAWAEMPTLRMLDLRDTRVTGKNMPKLLASEDLRILRLDRTGVTPADLSSLGDHFNLSHLTLAGVGIDTKTLATILGNGLTRLDLSDSKLDPGIYPLLQTQGRAMQHLVLQDCEVDSKELYQVALNARSLLFDLTGSDATTQLQTMLLSSRRIGDADEVDQRLAMQAAMTSANYGYAPVVAVSKPPSIIRLSSFAPRSRVNVGGGLGSPMGTVVSGGSSIQAVPQQKSSVGGWLSEVFLGKGSDDADSDSAETDKTEPDSAKPDSATTEIEKKEPGESKAVDPGILETGFPEIEFSRSGESATETKEQD